MHRLMFSLALFATGSAVAAVPGTLTHTGRLFDVDGAPLEGEHTLTVRLYDDGSGGTARWEETLPVSLVSGYFAVVLGSSNPLDPSILDGNARFVSLEVDGGGELPARVPLSAVPYAIRAAVAENVAASATLDVAGLTVGGQSVVSADGTIPWERVSGAPEDADTLGDLLCDADAAPVFDGVAWACGAGGSDTFDAAALVSGTIAPERLPIGTGPSEVAAGSHGHDASEVRTGTLDAGRLPIGTSAGTVAAGDHTHDAAAITSGSFDAARIPNLDAAKITSGVLDAARIPNLDAAKITTGTLGAARIPDLDAAKITTGTLAVARLPVGTTATTVAAGNHTHDAAVITSGTLAKARLPTLVAADVGAVPATGGTFSGDVTVSGKLTSPSLPWIVTSPDTDTSCTGAGTSGGFCTIPQGGIWRVPSTNTNLTLARRSTIKLTLTGTVDIGNTNGTGACGDHLGAGFYQGNTQLGSTSWGEAVIGIPNGNDVGWWKDYNVQRVMTLDAGSYTFQGFLYNWGGGCNVIGVQTGQAYSWPQLTIEVYPL